MDSEGYWTVSHPGIGEIVDRKSRFIGQIVPVQTEEEALAFIESVKAQHRSARHNVYAYVLRGGRMRFTDDGEPAQTAGKPTLETLLHAHLEDVACVVTRYFGGILLGTGGLVRAYTQATQAAIAAADPVQMLPCVELVIEIAYNLYDSVTKVLENYRHQVLSTDFGASVLLTVRVKANEAESLVAKLVDLSSGTAEILEGDVTEASLPQA